MSIAGAAHSQTQEAIIHHAANAAAIVFPVSAVLLHMPEVIAIITGLLGIIWYSILIVEKVALWRTQWRQTRESANRVAIVLQEERHGNETPSD
jgi:hypothetical protein